jgi:hypothetical protein
MRWALTALAAAAVATAAAQAAPAAQLYRVVCGVTRFDITFSQERGIVVRVGQANIVRATSTNAAWAKRCRKTSDFVTSWGGGPSRRSTADVTLACHPPVLAAVEFKAVDYQSSAGSGAAFAATFGHTKGMFVLAKLYKAGAPSEIRWDTRYCRRQ